MQELVDWQCNVCSIDVCLNSVHNSVNNSQFTLELNAILPIDSSHILLVLSGGGWSCGPWASGCCCCCWTRQMPMSEASSATIASMRTGWRTALGLHADVNPEMFASSMRAKSPTTPQACKMKSPRGQSTCSRWDAPFMGCAKTVSAMAPARWATPTSNANAAVQTAVSRQTGWVMGTMNIAVVQWLT